MIALVDSRKTRQRREPDKERTSNIGLFVTERFPAWAEALRPPVCRRSSVALVVLVAMAFLANLRGIRNRFGTGAIIAAFLVIAGAFLIGYTSANTIRKSEVCSSCRGAT